MSIYETREKQKDENRRKFPLAGERVDELREDFGDGVRLTYAEENGQSIGKKLTGYFMSASQWMHLSGLIEFEKKIRKIK